MDAEKADVERRFLGLPSLGGKLAIVNCLLWVGIFWLFQNRLFLPSAAEMCLSYVLMFLSLPLAFPILLPSTGTRTEIEVFTNCIWIGINSFVWGYGIAWAWSKFFRRRRMPPTGS